MNARSPVANISDTVAVDSTTSTEVLAANLSRIYLRISNDDAANPVYLALQTDTDVTPTAVVGEGLRLAAGETWECTHYTGSVYGLAGTADVDVCVVEV